MSEKGDAVWWVRDSPPSLFGKGGFGGFSLDELSALYSALFEAVFNARLALLRHPLKPTQEDETRVRGYWEAIEKLFDGWIKTSGWLKPSEREKWPQPFGLLAQPNSPEEFRELEVQRLKANSFELLERVISEDDSLSANKERFVAVLVLHEAFEGSAATAIRGGVELRMFHERRISEHLGYGSELVKALEDQIANAEERARKELASDAALAKAAKYDPLIKSIVELYHASRGKYPNRRAWIDDIVEPRLESLTEQANRKIGEGKPKLSRPDRDTIERWLRKQRLT